MTHMTIMITALRIALFHRLSTTVLSFQPNIQLYKRALNHVTPTHIRPYHNTALMLSSQQPQIQLVNKMQLEDIISQVENENNKEYVVIDVRGADEIQQTTGKVSDCVKNISIEAIGMVCALCKSINQLTESIYVV